MHCPLPEGISTRSIAREVPLGGNGISVFDPLLPGVCLHASCYTLFLGPIVLFCL